VTLRGELSRIRCKENFVRREAVREKLMRGEDLVMLN